MNKQNNLSVTVGIAAYNEEKNIANILQDILSQKQTNWTLKEIIVVSDGSHDKTVKRAKSVKSDKIQVYKDNQRKGKPQRIGEIFVKTRGEIIVIFDADIKLKNDNVINNLIAPFYKNIKTMLVGGNTRPFPPKNFLQRGIYATFKVFDESRLYKNNGNNIFGCNGGCLAVRKTFADQIKFPNVLNEDDFLYFSCLSKGYNFRHVREAVVFYKMPLTTKDHMKQTLRSSPEAITLNYKKYFGKTVATEYSRPSAFYIKSILKTFLKDPLPTTYIVIVNFFTHKIIPLVTKNYKLSWYTAKSTK